MTNLTRQNNYKPITKDGIDPHYFRAVYQHFEEGLFDKTLSMEQAKQLAMLIMSHVPRQERQEVTLNEQSSLTQRVQRQLPAASGSDLEEE